MKNIKLLTQLKKASLKKKVVVATTIMGITLVSIGINNVNYNNSASSANKYVQVLGSVVKQPVVAKIQYGVTTSIVNIRAGASTTSSMQGKLANKTEIKILEKKGDFYKVSYSGKTGYVSSKYVKIIAKPAAGVTSQTVSKVQDGVTTSIVNIRTGASTTSSIQGKLANKTKVKIMGKVGSFYKISYSGKTGYVSNQYVKITTK
ncbi:SH3 domain-containing protein [Clostridium estertheticum]|uniref:SH3 domain-containing protein n=1 Tax=Clostridium estertheticum TaxID=238834 RepID=UPI001CF4384F|nr:SH3 domain-containing protein [Clostridium estertheticum]MCB2307770.1 SH3 domain-containing protein [Clostridium estertheticum]MCB2345900.1 SH3 domain-containing protein [Clostridium estertheticum]MCB2351158.1 SH3 domain-containing protein [Clostridium estertheticum]WAG44747.1 SH3 domain-containing protein [Clostridium estertheticum]